MAIPYSIPPTPPTTPTASGNFKLDEAVHGRSAVHMVASPSEAAHQAGASSASAVSWSAIFAGAAAASALSLILLILGTGLGLSSVSPWASAGIGATAFGVSTILWLSATQFVASGMGGYLAGRLRTKYVAVHDDEVYFRDTAHGFLTWAVASLITASVLASAVGGIVGMGASLAGDVASGAAAAATNSMTATTSASSRSVAGPSPSTGISSGVADPVGYLMDSMLRKSGNAPAVAGGAYADAGASVSSADISRVFMHSIGQGALPAEDAKYLAGVVAFKTGLTPDEAEARVKATYDRVQIKLREAEASARQAADTTRKATAYSALWLFVSLLIGAFFASWGATFGGRHRDL